MEGLLQINHYRCQDVEISHYSMLQNVSINTNLEIKWHWSTFVPTFVLLPCEERFWDFGYCFVE